MTEVGVPVFDTKTYFPESLKPEKIDFDWVINAGFPKEEMRVEFLKNLKNAMRDYWFGQIIKRTQKKEPSPPLKPPNTGELRIFVTEAHNLGINAYNAHIDKSSNRKASDKLYVKLSFRVPILVEDIRKPVFREKPETGEQQATFDHNVYKVEHIIEENPIWITPENPEGTMISLGKVTEMPQSSVFLYVIVSSPYEENGKPHEYFFGNAE